MNEALVSHLNRSWLVEIPQWLIVCHRVSACVNNAEEVRRSIKLRPHICNSNLPCKGKHYFCCTSVAARALVFPFPFYNLILLLGIVIFIFHHHYASPETSERSGFTSLNEFCTRLAPFCVLTVGM